MLGMVQAIAMRTLADSPSLSAFLSGGGHQSYAEPAGAREFRTSAAHRSLRLEFDAIPIPPAGRILRSEVLLNFESAQTLALALHELATMPSSTVHWASTAARSPCRGRSRKRPRGRS